MNNTLKKRSFKENFNLIKRALGLIKTFEKHYLFHLNVFSIVYSAELVVSKYITAAIISELVGDKNIKKLIILACCYFLEVIFHILREKSWHKIRSFNLIADKWQEKLLNEKNFSMDYKNMEDARIRAMRQTLTNKSAGAQTGFGTLTSLMVSLGLRFWMTLMCIAISFEMLFLHSEKPLNGFYAFIDSPFAAIIFFGIIAALIFFNYKSCSKYSRLAVDDLKNCQHSERLLHYYLNDYSDDGKAGKDIHIFAQKALINYSSEIFYNEWKRFKDSRFKHEKDRSVYHNIAYFAITLITYIFVAAKIYIGSVPLGALFKYQFCISKIAKSALDLANIFARLKANNDFLELFFEYTDLPTEMHYGTIPTEKRTDNKYDIEFHKVSFKYPGSDTYALKNISFKFKVGESIAVVGQNGSGKTTLIKLLCRLYDPTEGYITLNGIDIKKYNYEDYLALFGTVFQDFRLFSLSVGENVAASRDFECERVNIALETAGILDRVESMPKKLDTSIYKDFDEDGVEISGGEAQKLAISRALYKDAAFVILDEPTAALDPLAEYEIYSRFNEMVKNKTAVYISHRLSSCIFCDKIAVFSEGMLTQFGTHESLLKDETGKYHALWNAQAKYYTEKSASSEVG